MCSQPPCIWRAAPPTALASSYTGAAASNANKTPHSMPACQPSPVSPCMAGAWLVLPGQQERGGSTQRTFALFAGYVVNQKNISTIYKMLLRSWLVSSSGVLCCRTAELASWRGVPQQMRHGGMWDWLRPARAVVSRVMGAELTCLHSRRHLSAAFPGHEPIRPCSGHEPSSSFKGAGPAVKQRHKNTKRAALRAAPARAVSCCPHMHPP